MHILLIAKAPLNEFLLFAMLNIISILSYASQIGLGICLLMALEQLFSRRRNSINIISSLLLFCNAAIIMGSLLIAYEIPFHYPWSIYFFITSLYSIGPLNLFYYNALTNTREIALRKLLIHLIPALLVLIIETSFQCMDHTIKVSILKSFISPMMFNKTTILIITSAIHPQTYLLYLVSMEFSLWGAQDIREEITVITMVNMLAIIAGIVLFLGFILGYSILFLTGSSLISLIHMVIFIAHSRSPHFFHILKRHIAEKKYKNSLLKGINTNDIANRLEYLMKTEKLYTDYELSMPKLAKKLYLTPHQLSQFLNEQMTENFQSYINRHRIEEACRLLREEPESTILSICFHVGFNSKSAFNRAFKKYTGRNPVDFRK